ncbi:MAG: 3-methyladenine DNA glycosylase [Chloroflexota bacterium]|nr:MAG: 3-methyladenine DNA glycosylase [Chloroflexota bacterium]
MPRLTLSGPPDFRFLPTVLSHGWCVLRPFSYREDSRALHRVERLRDGTLVVLEIREGVAPNEVLVEVESDNDLSAEQIDEIRAAVARCLGFDRRLDEFYEIARSVPGYEWIPETGAGRMLASPTEWEDLAKTLLTTNTTWRMTKEMVSRLTTLGDARDGQHAFPTPEQVAALDAGQLNEHVRAGYRGAYLHDLAVALVERRINPEAWRDPALDSKDVYRQLTSLKGFGPYASGAMMRLLGRFDELGLDSVCRAMFRDLWNNGVSASDREIAAHYAPFGRWRGLAVWLDVMREELLAASPTNPY